MCKIFYRANQLIKETERYSKENLRNGGFYSQLKEIERT